MAIHEEKMNPLEVAASKGFGLIQADQAFGLGAVLFLSLQPLANVVADYACQYGENKGEYVLHEVHLQSAGGTQHEAL